MADPVASYNELKSSMRKRADASDKKSKDDACTRKVKAQYDTWPSARASQAVAKCRKSKGQVKKSEKGASLKRWQKEEWKTGSGKPCGAEGAGGSKSYCRPTKKVSKSTPSTKRPAKQAAQKRAGKRASPQRKEKK